MKALSFGEILWDVYPDKKCLGGAPLNFAAHFAKQGGQAYMISAVGNDELGLSALKKISEWNVDTKYISVLNDRPTGRCVVALNGQSVPEYNVLNNVSYDYIPYQNISEKFDLLYFGTLALRSGNNLKVLKKILAENKFPEILVDINIRPPFSSKSSVLFAVKTADTIKISSEELNTVADFLDIHDFSDCGGFSLKLAERFANLKRIVITLSSDGAYCMDCENGKSFRCPAVETKVLSTVGAGDSFAASFIYNFLNKKDIQYCLKSAAETASYVVSKYDAVPD